MATPEDIRIEIYPLGLFADPVDITDRVIIESWTTVVPGGDGELRLTRNDAEDQVNTGYTTSLGAIIRAGTRIVIRDGPGDEGVFWVGRIEVPGGNFWPSGGQIQTICRGYSSSARDQIYRSGPKTWGAGFNVMTIYGDSCEELCPDITEPGLRLNSTMFNMGRTLQEQSRDYCLSNAQDIWNNCATVPPSLGGVADPLIWRVYNVDSLGTQYGIIPVLNVKPRPGLGQISYYTTMAPSGVHRGGTRVNVTADVQNVYNRATVKFDNPDRRRSYLTVTEPPGADPFFGGGHGIRAFRDLGIDKQGLGNGDLPDDIVAATALATARARMDAQTILATAARLQVTGGTVELSFPQRVLDASLAPYDLWRIRAGEVIQVEDWRPQDGFFIDSLPLSYNEFYVVGTTWNHRRRTMTCQIGVRSTFTEAVGRALKSKQQGREDYTKSGVPPQPGRLVQPQGWSDMLPFRGSTNVEAPYANALHMHGTPNGDISTTTSWAVAPSDANPVVPVGLVHPIGLVRGTWTRCEIACEPGKQVKLHVELPGGVWSSQDGARHGTIDPQQFDVEGPNGHVYHFAQEMQTSTVGKVTITDNHDNPNGIRGPYYVALVFHGTRNLLIDDESPSSRKHGAEL